MFFKMILDCVFDNMFKVYFGFGGLDVNEINVKLIWYYNNIFGWFEKKKIILCWCGYYGLGLVIGLLMGLELFYRKFDLLFV